MDTEETRAAIARRRLAQLVASFDGEHVQPAGVQEKEEAGPPDREPPDLDGLAPARAARVSIRSLRITGLHGRLVVGAAAAIAVVVAWSLFSGRPESVPAQAPDAPLATSSATVQTADIVVDVVGHVQRPGIVTLPAGSRVHEAIEAAGGLVGEVDTAGLNMARKLNDGEQLLVGIAPVTPDTGGAATDGGRTNLNSATLEDLDALPGVGPVTAAAIVDWRTDNGPFRSIDDLLEVRGIGEATLDELRDLVTV